MSSLWRSRILNTQDVAGASGLTRGDIATYRSHRRSRRRREREEEEQRQELEKRLKEHEEKVTADIEWRVAAVVNEMAPSRGMPLVQVPSAHKNSCELHKPFDNIKMKICIIHDFITSIIDHIYYFDFCGQASTMLILTN
jgi:hypothetical protein